MPEEITHETFTGHEGQTFLVHVESEALELELTEVEVPQVRHLPEGFRQPFTLIFQGTKERILPEGHYSVESSSAGRFDLYLIPIVSMGPRQSYQVVFN